MDQPSTPPPSSQLPAHRSMSLGASPPWMLLIIAGCAGLVLGMVAMMSVLHTDQTAVDPQPETGTNTTTTTVDISAEELAELQNAAGEIPVIWQPPEKVDPTKEFPGANLLAVIPYNYNQYGSLDDLPTTAVATSTFSYYRRGNIAGTPDTLFSGDVIYLVIADNLKNTYSEMGIGEPAIPPSFYLIKHTLPGSRVIRYIAFTGREGEGYMPTDGFMPGNDLVISTTNLHLPRSSFPETITLQNGKILHRSPTQPTSFLTATTALCTDEGCPNKTPIAKTTDGQSVYAGLSIGTNFNSFDQPGCLAIFAPSGEAQLYVSLIETTEIDPGRSYENHPFPMLTTKGLELDAAYTLASSTAFIPFAMGGCGGLGCPEVLPASSTSTPTMDQLKQIGKTKAGEPIYLPKDLRKSEISQSVYEMWYEYDTNGKKPSFDAFLQRFSVPYFLWKDGLGRFVLYRNNQFVPLAECGKPVIYLYPTKTQNVQVSLPSFINVTVSEPTYPKNGWNVTAQPNGQLTMKDGSTHGSLFWEGTGVNYPAPTTGFVVKEGNVESFLVSTLAKYGLNAQEIKEFNEFWVPKMVGAPYYRVSFLTNEWSQAAPLNVSPAPNTRIRLFMDWQKLNAPISLPQPTITTPTRNGFTLVEWGGLLQK